MQRYGLTLTAPPSAEPVTLAEAKAHCRVEVSDDDALIGALVTAARDLCERQLSQAFVTQSWLMTIDQFPLEFGYRSAAWLAPGWSNSGSVWPGREIEIPLPPLRSVQSVQYVDPNGVLQTMPATDYDVDAARQPGRIAPAYGKFWPITRAQVSAVRIAFTAGYSAVPEPIKVAIKMLVAHWYENRETVITQGSATALPMAVEALLASVWHGSYS